MIGCKTLKAKVIDGVLYYVCRDCGKMWEQRSRGTFMLAAESFTEEELES